MNPGLEFERGLSELGLALPATGVDQLRAFAALLEKWNRTYNLTAVRDEPGVFRRHLLDSLAIWPWVGDGPLLDVGSGGGFPGVPLAIIRPQQAVTVIDSNSKKTAFLRQAAIELGIANLAVQTARVEEWRPASVFPQIVSRAFSQLGDFVRLTRHLLATDGHWLAMKGVRPDAEIASLPDDVLVDAVHRLQVPGVEGDRHLVIIVSARSGVRGGY